MKTISVREAAEALGVSPRTIQYKLQNGNLKGNRQKNQFGVEEWRIWPNKEIAEAIAKKSGNREFVEQTNFEPAESDVVEAESVGSVEAELDSRPQSWKDVEVERLEVLAEKLIKPLAQRLEAQAAELRDKDRLLEEKDRQLRLLPDLEKRAEKERKASETRALEVEALKKQIAAIEEEKEQLQAKATEASALINDLQTLKTKVDELQRPWWKKLFGTDSKPV